MSGKFGKCFRLGGRYCIGVRRNKREVGRRRGWGRRGQGGDGEDGREEGGDRGDEGEEDGEWTREKRWGVDKGEEDGEETGEKVGEDRSRVGGR